ncbi:MAG TPA: ABC transporter ATP-binding protein [Bifidobacterium sp.]|nr:ABC transporter ATP-binding protein [Bifidobacterium sp.]
MPVTISFDSIGELYAACLLAIVIAAVMRLLMARAAAHFGTEAAERVKLALRSELFGKMLRLGPSYSQRVGTADVVQSAGEGIDQIQSFFELFLPQLFYAILAPVTLFVVVAPVNMPAAVTLLVCAPLIVLIVGMVAMSAARVFKKYWGKYTDMGSAFLDDLQGLETLKTFDADGRAARDMDEKAEQFRVMTMNVLQIQLRSLTAMDVVAYGGAAAGIGVAVWRYFHGGLTLGGVLLIVLLSADFFIPLRQLGSFFHVAMNGMTSTKRIFALLDAPEPEHGDEESPRFGADGTKVGVEFRNVAYRYADGEANNDAVDEGDAASPAADTDADAVSDADQPSGPYALRDVDFTAQPGRITAIVGPSGSGKSTAVRLLAGTLTGYRGRLGLDERLADGESSAFFDIDRLTVESLTREISIVGARNHLFAGTLRDNLLMADPSADERRLWQALEDAHIDDFVRTQAQGLDMRIEQGAGNLSGGQCQRIAIARVLLRQSAVCIFDEATSSVDVESETLILRTMRALADAGRTVIMVTHRMANAADADHVVVFDHGRAVEQGSHAELLAANGVYARLFRAQETVEQVGRRSMPADGPEPVPLRDLEEMDGNVHDAPRINAPRMSGSSTACTIPPSDFAESDAYAIDGVSPDSGSDESRIQVEKAVHVSENVSGCKNVSGSENALGSENVPSSRKTDETAGAAGADKTDIASAPASRVIVRLLKEVGPLRKYMIIACVCGTIGHLAATFLPVFGIAAAFAVIGVPVWNLDVAEALAGMIVCALIRGGMRYAEQYMNHNVAFRLLALLRAKAFAALRRLAPAKLAGKGKGDLIALVTTDVELLEIFFAHTISPVIIAIVTTVIYAIALCTLSPAFAIVLIVAHLAVGVALPKLFALAVRGQGARIRGESAELNDAMLDDMRGIEEIIRFGQGDSRLAGIVTRSRALWRERSRLSARNGDFTGLGAVLVMLFTALAAGLTFMVSAYAPYSAFTAAVSDIAHMAGAQAAGGMDATGIAGVMSFADWSGKSLVAAAVAAFTLIASSFGPVLALGALPANLTQTFAAARRLFSLMDESPAVEERGTERPRYQGMTACDVTFGYGSDDGPKPVLDHVSLDVSRHGVLGVQGPSGRGKSTLLKLLMRYWDPSSGTVVLSDVPLPNVDAAWRRRVQTMMGQESYLFDGTIRENLMMALPDRDASHAADAIDRKLRDALARASALELVDSLPQGLDTQVGELGGRLSEGERQRIGLARVFLRDADLVLFDEPTSRLDAYNESVILQSINGLADQGRAIVLVSHRDSTMRIADRIVRM